MRAAEAEKLSGLQAYTTSLEKSIRNAQKIIKERDEVPLFFIVVSCSGFPTLAFICTPALLSIPILSVFVTLSFALRRLAYQTVKRIATLETELADAKRELGLVQAWTQRPRKSCTTLLLLCCILNVSVFFFV